MKRRFALGFSLLLVGHICFGQDSLKPPADVAAPSSGAVANFPGIFTVTLQPPLGSDTPTDNDCVIVRFVAWKPDGSLFSTSGPGNQTTVQCLSTALPEWRNVLKLMSPGEKRRAWISSLTAKDDDGKESAPQAVTLDLQLVDILKAPPTPPDLRKPPASATCFRSGVRMNVIRAGGGSVHPAVTSKLTVNYTEWSEGGALLETTAMSAHPAVLSLNATPISWRDALVGMTVGEKVRLWIPSTLASPNRKLGNVVYDLELVKID